MKFDKGNLNYTVNPDDGCGRNLAMMKVLPFSRTAASLVMLFDRKAVRYRRADL
jgi:hypothetical protein